MIQINLNKNLWEIFKLKLEKTKILKKKKKKVALNMFIPDGEVKAVVQLSHGMAEHSMRYEELGKFLCDNNLFAPKIVAHSSAVGARPYSPELLSIVNIISLSLVYISQRLD